LWDFFRFSFKSKNPAFYFNKKLQKFLWRFCKFCGGKRPFYAYLRGNFGVVGGIAGLALFFAKFVDKRAQQCGNSSIYTKQERFFVEIGFDSRQPPNKKSTAGEIQWLYRKN